MPPRRRSSPVVPASVLAWRRRKISPACCSTQLGVQLALAREVLVDQRLRDARGGRSHPARRRGSRGGRTPRSRRRAARSRRCGGAHAPAGGPPWRGILAGRVAPVCGAIDWAAEGMLDGLDGTRAGARGAARRSSPPRACRSTSCAARQRRAPARLLAAERARGRPAALLGARGRASGPGADPSSSWPCAARTGCRCPTPTRACCTTPTSSGAQIARALPGLGRRAEQMLAMARVMGHAAAPDRRADGRACCSSCRSSRARRGRAGRSATPPARRAVMPLIGAVLEQMLRLHLRQTVRTRGDQRRRARRRARCPARARCGRLRRPRRLHAAGRGGRRRRARRASPTASSSSPRDVVDPPVRFVKTIGDAAMLVAPDARRLLDARARPHRRRRRRGRGLPAAARRRRLRRRRSAAAATGSGGR